MGQGRREKRSKEVHHRAGHSLARRHTASCLGTWEIFGENVSDGLGISWNSPLDTLLQGVKERKNLLVGSFPLLDSHYLEFTALCSCWERPNLHESSWVGSGCRSC